MGQHEYRLKALADDELLAGLSSIVGRRNQITAEFLAYLAELDERQIFLDLGFASLFEYCVEKLGLCESTAGRHIAAARVCRNHPEVFAMVASGALHASALSLLRKHLTPENAAELFQLCAHRSARKVEELLAARFPRPDVRDLVRRLTRFAIPEGVPTQARLTPDVGCASEKMPTEAPPGEPTAPLQKAFGESRSREPSTPRRSRSVEPEPSAPSEAELSAPDLRKPEPSTPGPSDLDAQSTPNQKSNPKRHCPAAVARAVFLRDGQQCSYVSPDGRRCSARRCLELDHVEPWAVCGESTMENLRLRCRAHNQRYARQYFGKSRVEAAVQLARRRRAAAEGPGTS